MRINNGKSRYVILVFAAIGFTAVLSCNAQDHSADNPVADEYAANEGELAWIGFDEGMKRAASENKLILVDVYTDWCHWCKEMDKNVYTNDSIIELIGRNYIPVKLNAESDDVIVFNDESITKRRWTANMGVTGYPTTIFLDSDGEPITLLPGYVEVPLFTDVLQYVSLEALNENIPFATWQKNKNRD